MIDQNDEPLLILGEFDNGYLKEMFTSRKLRNFDHDPETAMKIRLNPWAILFGYVLGDVVMKLWEKWH